MRLSLVAGFFLSFALACAGPNDDDDDAEDALDEADADEDKFPDGCSDGEDNDLDGETDCRDYDCYTSSDCEDDTDTLAVSAAETGLGLGAQVSYACAFFAWVLLAYSGPRTKGELAESGKDEA